MIVGLTDAPIFPPGADWDAAQATLANLGLGDGLPLVVPTRQRLEAMLAGVSDPGRALGHMPPLLGEVTAQAVAYCCVLAGCQPAEMPVVLAAAVATLAPSFNLLGIQTTTGGVAVCLAVHGGVARRLGMNAKANCLGPGNRANACIGRALQLVLHNVGGTLPGVTDMATMGQPGKYVFCFATHDVSGISSFAALDDPEAGGVTVIGVSGTMEAIPAAAGDTPAAVLLPAIRAMHGGRSGVSAATDQENGWRDEQYLLLPPEPAAVLKRHGWGLEAVQEYILANSPQGAEGVPWPLASAPGRIRVFSTGGVGIKMTLLLPWNGGSRSVSSVMATGAQV